MAYAELFESILEPEIEDAEEGKPHFVDYTTCSATTLTLPPRNILALLAAHSLVQPGLRRPQGQHRRRARRRRRLHDPSVPRRPVL